MSEKEQQIRILYPGESFVAVDGAYIGDKGTILRANGKKIDTYPIISIKGKRFRRANLIASVWLDKPSRKANLGFKDGDKTNLRKENLYYK